jgi:hypothetical protein
MSLCEGLVKHLDPDFDIVATAMPYFARYHPLVASGLLPTTSTSKPEKN